MSDVNSWLWDLLLVWFMDVLNFCSAQINYRTLLGVDVVVTPRLPALPHPLARSPQSSTIGLPSVHWHIKGTIRSVRLPKKLLSPQLLRPLTSSSQKFLVHRPLSRIPYHGSGDRETRLGLPGQYDSRLLECRETVRPTWPDHWPAAAALLVHMAIIT